MELTKPLKLGTAELLWYSPDGKRLAVRSSQLSVWDLEKKTRLWRSAPVPYLYYATFSPDSQRLAVKSTTGQIAVVDATSGKVICDFRNKKDGEGCNPSFSPCGKYIIDGTWEGRLLVREAATGKVQCEHNFPNEMIHDIYAVDNGSSWLVVHNPVPGEDDGEEEEPPPPYVSQWKWPISKKPANIVKLPDILLLTTSISPDGQFLAFDSNLRPKQPAVDILSLRNGKTVASIPRTREERLEHLTWSADSKLLGVVKRNAVVIYTAGKFEPIVEHELADASDVAFSPAGDTIALGARDATVLAWNQLIPATGKALQPKAKPKTTSAAPASFISAADHQKVFKKILGTLPAKSQIRRLLSEVAVGDEDRRVAAYERAFDFDKSKGSEDVFAPTWRLNVNEAVSILSAGGIAEFPPPPPDADWKDGYHALLQLLWRSPHPSLLPHVAPAYEKQPRGLRRAALLALLGSLGTRKAAETFTACIRKFGWPPLYQRVWWELEKLLVHGDALLPDIALAAGKEHIGDLVDVITSALSEGTLKLEQIAGRIDALAPATVASIKKLIKQLSKYQTRKGIAWRFTDSYSYARYSLSSLLNLAGYMIEPKLLPLLREAAKFTDPLIAMSAAIAMLRQSGDVSKLALRRAAQANETRALLFESLAELKRKDLFPKQFATWEALAASAMVEWLKFPAELGCEPDELQLAHTEWLDQRCKLAMYVWKFRSEKDPWLAGVSGPHELRGSPKPTGGSLTFSRFDEWESATPQVHLELCAGNAHDILKAHCD